MPLDFLFILENSMAFFNFLKVLSPFIFLIMNFVITKSSKSMDFSCFSFEK